MMKLDQVKPPLPQEKKSSLEDTMAELATIQVEMQKSQVELHKSQAQFVNETRTSHNNQYAQIKNLEVQMGQMTTILSERQ